MPGEAQQSFRTRLVLRGREVLEQAPGGTLWIVTGRPYNLYDERLNLQMGRHLAKRGILAIPMDFLDLDAEDLSDFPQMYWGSGPGSFVPQR